MEILGLIILIIIGLLIYFIPSFMAGSKHKKDGVAITMLNLFLGWTFVGWVVALVWACTNDKQ
jgi:hypothetical protein